MERAEAEAIYDQGGEAVVVALLTLSAQVAALEALVRKQEERIAELERRLSRDSKDSSLPPSQDPPEAPKRQQTRSSGRKRGAQSGHKGNGRHLVPAEAVDEVVDHWPERCRCGHRFTAAERCSLGRPARHQVAELPPIAVRAIEHRLRHVRCPKCGRSVRATLPRGVPRGAFGPRLQAAVATLAVRNRISRRDAVELMRDLFGARMDVGSVDAILWRTADALYAPYEQLLRRTRASPAVNVDTGRPCGRLRACPAWSLPTTMRSGACGERSSCARSRSAASQTTASASLSACSRPRPPAACRSAPSLPTFPRYSPPATAEPPSLRSSDSQRTD